MIRALFRHVGEEGRAQDPSQFILVEKWRRIERPLNGGRRIVRVWEAWGEDKSEVGHVITSHKHSDVTAMVIVLCLKVI